MLGKVIVLLAATFDATAGLDCAAAVAVRSRSTVTETYFRLGDVADVRAEPKALQQALFELRIGRSPRGAGASAFMRSDLERLVSRAMPQMKLCFEGPARFGVQRGPLQSLELSQLSAAARQALARFVAERSTRSSIEPFGQQPDAPLWLPAGAVELRPRIAATTAVAPRMDVWMDVYVDGLQQQSVPVTFAVQARRPVLCARVALAAGALLAPGQFGIEERDIATGESWLAADAPLVGVRLKRALAPGEALMAKDVEMAPVVAKSERVRVRLSSGAIDLETVGIASRDAKPGEVIRVRTENDDRSYPARVTGAGAVQALWR